MKILQIGNYPEQASLLKGGVQASIYGISQTLSADNEVVVLGYPLREIAKDYNKQDGKVSAYYFRNPYKRDIQSVFRLRTLIKAIKKEKADIIHIHGTALLFFFLIVYLKMTQRKYILTVHGIRYIEEWKVWKRDRSLKAVISFFVYLIVEFISINLSSQIIVDTKYVKIKLKKITSRKMAVIPQGIDESFYHLKDDYDKMNLISIGVISERKGYAHSINAIKSVVEKFPKVNYTIVGVLPNDSGDYYQLLLDQIKNLNLENNVTIKINLQFNDVLPILSQANIFLLHSSEESQGIVFCEAMAAGKPIVATNVGGIPYVVENNINGKLSDYGDDYSFAENIMSILFNNELRLKMSDSSKVLSKQYSWNLIAKAVITVYNNTHFR